MGDIGAFNSDDWRLACWNVLPRSLQLSFRKREDGCFATGLLLCCCVAYGLCFILRRTHSPQFAVGFNCKVKCPNTFHKISASACTACCFLEWILRTAKPKLLSASGSIVSFVTLWLGGQGLQMTLACIFASSSPSKNVQDFNSLESTSFWQVQSWPQSASSTDIPDSASLCCALEALTFPSVPSQAFGSFGSFVASAECSIRAECTCNREKNILHSEATSWKDFN